MSEFDGAMPGLAALAGRLDRLARQNDERAAAELAALQDFLRLQDPRLADPRALAGAHGQVYSQNNEDGILAEIFRRIGASNRRFLEIGVGDGSENNTRLLLDLGWEGVWIEGDAVFCDQIRTRLAAFLDEGRLHLVAATVDRDTVADSILIGFRASTLAEIPLDLLSIDIDANTSHVWAALGSLRPRVACIEYNAHYPPSVDWEIPYQPDGIWRGDTRFGASLKRLEWIGAELDYRLVGCDLMGVNAFFVRADLCDPSIFLAPFDAETHHQPPRFGWVHMRGHRRFLGS